MRGTGIKRGRRNAPRYVSEGFFLSLDAALIGAGIECKVHTVILNNGETFPRDERSHGAQIVEKWRV